MLTWQQNHYIIVGLILALLRQTWINFIAPYVEIKCYFITNLIYLNWQKIVLSAILYNAFSDLLEYEL